ncbi:MAG: regulatory protein RecX [Bacteroidota bacterium]
MTKKKSKYVSKEEGLAKLQKYCAYQDRCHQEVRNKLLELGIYGDDLEEIISDLIGENFLNEERFARSYARGKFRIKRWGKLRIQQELKKRKISAYCLKKAMQELDEEDYEGILRVLVDKRRAQEKEKNEYKKKIKIAQHLIRRGFESHLVWGILNEAHSRKSR